MSTQGSASYTIVIGGVTAIIVGGMVLTLAFYPIATAFMDAAFWGAETTHGSRVVTYTAGIWTFWGAILLMSILSWVWIRTRQ